MDEIGKYNKTRWKALAEADALFTRPNFDLTIETARQLINSDNRFGDLKGKKVLCLAGGGGQQSTAFALLKADVMVFDISDEQLERDKKVAEHYGFEIETVQGDMRDLSKFNDDQFDVIHHPYSINFVPDASKVLKEVSRILKSGGTYQLQFANPFAMGLNQKSWNGKGYILQGTYESNAEITYADQDWVYEKSENKPIPQPKEYRHNLGDLINTLTSLGFIIKELSDNENMHPDPNAEPGSWDHFVAYAPPWLSVLAILRPDLKF